MGALRRHYGAGPLHLLALLSCFAFSGYVATRVVGAPGAARIGLWFGGAVIGHDLVLYPLYTVADHVLHPRTTRPRRAARVLTTNHLRIPALISGLLLLIWFPLIFGLSADAYHANIGLTTQPYLGRWLLVTGILFGGSALLLALRMGVRSRRAGQAPRPAADQRHPN